MYPWASRTRCSMFKMCFPLSDFAIVGQVWLETLDTLKESHVADLHRIRCTRTTPKAMTAGGRKASRLGLFRAASGACRFGGPSMKKTRLYPRQSMKAVIACSTSFG